MFKIPSPLINPRKHSLVIKNKGKHFHLPEASASLRPGTAAALWRGRLWGAGQDWDSATVCLNPLHLKNSGDYMHKKTEMENTAPNKSFKHF